MSKIFNIGFSRTGTTSLTEALQILGFSAYHFPKSFDQIEKHDACTDMSITLGYKFLDLMYPESKYILTTRKLESWLSSMEVLFAQWNIEHDTPGYPTDYMHYAIYGTVKFDEDKMAKAYFNHIDDVKNYFKYKHEDLLELDIDSDNKWEKLCTFLNVEIPDVPYPHSNKRCVLSQSALE